MKKFSVKVENKEQYDELMRACEENGYRWNGGFDPRNVPHDVSHWIYPWYLTFDEKWIVLYTRSMENIVPLHKAMSYIYGETEFCYGARVRTKYGNGTIIARDCDLYLVKHDTNMSFVHDGLDCYLWGHGSDKCDAYWMSKSELTLLPDHTEDDLEKENTHYTAIRNCNTVIVVLEDGRKGFAVCSPRDEFDFQKGFEIAYNRAVKS